MSISAGSIVVNLAGLLTIFAAMISVALPAHARNGRKMTCTIMANGTSTQFESVYGASGSWGPQVDKCWPPAQCCPTGCCLLNGAKGRPLKYARWFIWILVLLVVTCILCILGCYVVYRKIYLHHNRVQCVTTTVAVASRDSLSVQLADRARPPDYNTCMSAGHPRPPPVDTAAAAVGTEPPPVYEDSVQHECLGGQPGAPQKHKCNCSKNKIVNRLNQSL